MKRIVADPTKCMACRGCELACALAHAGTDDLVVAIYEHGAKPRVYIEKAGNLAVPLQCRHCEDAPCVTVCPTGAVSRTSDSEPVLVDEKKCIGCGFCVEVCPFGVILVMPREEGGTPGGGKAAIKCDLCRDRQAEGLDPACVAACPVAALLFEEVDAGAQKARARAAAKAAAACARDGDE